MAIIQILKEKIKNFLTRKRLKYFLVLTLLIIISIGSYYFYDYYKLKFVTQGVVIIKFKPEATKEEAFKMLEKYVPGISSRTPRYYDNPNFASLEDSKAGEHSLMTIQFTVKGQYNWQKIKYQISREPIIYYPKNTSEPSEISISDFINYIEYKNYFIR